MEEIDCRETQTSSPISFDRKESQIIDYLYKYR